MSTFLSVKALHEEGVPKKTIARRLGIDPRTVRKYIRRIEAGETHPRRAAVPCKLDTFTEEIAAKVHQGLSAVQIHQDLQAVAGFDASYETVKRHVRGLRPPEPETYCRMRFAPGEEAQIDFAELGRVEIGGQRRKLQLFILTLCHSRLSHYEILLDQKVHSFLGAIGRSFAFFGGVPTRIKPDNLRSAVLFNHLGERYFQEDFFRFCRHYGTLPEPARVATPTDKGRCERGIRYVRGNFLRGRSFESVEQMREELERWRDEVANVRIHATTRRRPVDLFEVERVHLRPLPAEAYELADWGRYKVRKDCHVHILGNFYSVPWTLVGQRVLARVAEGEITLFADGEEVARHPRLEGKGGEVTDAAHYPLTKRISTQEIHRRRVMAIREAGPRTAEYLGRLREDRMVFGDQVARLARLVESHGADRVERACLRALHYGALGAASLERILDRGLEALPLPGVESPGDPSRDFGRPLGEYTALLAGGEVG